MAKSAVTDWDVTPANNSDIAGINISEGCPASGINDAIRTLMAQVATWLAGSNAPLPKSGGPVTGAITNLGNASSVIDGGGIARGIGYRTIPLTAKSSAYTIGLGDVGQGLSTSANVTVPVNATAAFAIGDTIALYNNSARKPAHPAGFLFLGRMNVPAFGARLNKFANDISNLPDPGKCLPNVEVFAKAHRAEAQRLAAALGNNVTPTEILATAGNETHYGDLKKGLAQYGNFFGIHGNGPAGTYYTMENHTPTAKFPIEKGFSASGDAFVRNLSPWMTPGLGKRPLDFFTVLNKHGYATGNRNYPGYMVNPAGNRGPYTLMRACTRQP